MISSEIVLKGDSGDILVEVIEQTILDGVNYVLVVEKNGDNSKDVASDFLEDIEEDCFILREVKMDDNGIAEYEIVDDDSEYEKVADVFKKILIRDDIELV